MTAKDLAIAQIVMVLDQTFEKGIKGAVASQYDLNRFKIRRVALQRGLINFDGGNITVAFVIVSLFYSEW